MMKRYTYLFFIALSFIFQACKKDSDTFIPDPGQITGPDTTWYATITPSMPVSLLRNDLLLQPQTDSFQVNGNSATVQFPSGLICTFPPNALVTNTGTPVSGKVDISSFLLQKKGDMIRMNRPTVSNGKLLVSGSSFYINVKQNGNNLQLAQQAHAFIRYADTGTSSLMQLFNGDESNPQNFNWVPDTDTSNLVFSNSPADPNYTGAGYHMVTSNLNWINCDYFYDTSAARVVVSAALPANYTNANSFAYLVFNDIRSISGMIGDINTRKFNSIPCPVGQAVTIVVISKQGNDYYLGHVTTSTTNLGSNYQAIPVTPVRSTANAVKQYLNSL